jgi:hypothetical protein
MTTRWLRTDLTYVRHLAEAGVDGITSVWNKPPAGTLAPDGGKVWLATALGGLVGGLSVLLTRNRNSRHGTAFGVLVGSATGFGGSVAWSSRTLGEAIRRSVVRKVNAVRDQRWLEKNPIDYA